MQTKNITDEKKNSGPPVPSPVPKKVKVNKLEDKTIWKLVEAASDEMIQADYQSFDLDLTMPRYRDFLMKSL